eukprot:TRINITY_DN5615_c0_g1_i1.p1 TRINITY_DN5615_c0_g1~~TRINITY_DN5615_c0_g1_i1.p1  ORF type:complete len:74 (+),score=10.59 TRINITY_DN5615_c0_g1_i1:28-222(+)
MSGLFNVYSAGGQVLGPLVGASLVSALGFRTAVFWTGIALFYQRLPVATNERHRAKTKTTRQKE